MQDDDGPAEAAVAHEQIAAQPDRRQRFVRRQLPDKRREIVAIGRHVDMLAGPAAAPARVTRQRGVVRQPAAQRREHLRLVLHHACALLMRPRERCGHLADRARPHRHDDVAIAGQRANRGRQIRDVFDEHRLHLAGDTNRSGKRAAVRRHDRRFAGRVDVGEHQRVGRRQHFHEILEQVARARVAMRLKHKHEAAPGKAAARGVDRRRHLGRVMAVVVDQRVRPASLHTRIAIPLKATAHAAEFGERLGDRGIGDPGLTADRDRGKRVAARCGAPGRLQFDLQIGPAFGASDELHAAAVRSRHRSPLSARRRRRRR